MKPHRPSFSPTSTLEMFHSPLVINGVIHLNGQEGMHGQNGPPGAHGMPGLDSVSPNPGLPGANGMPGMPGTMGTPGGHAGSISIRLERESASQLKLFVGDYCEVTNYPILVSANGGKGGNGGSGGVGGDGGAGGKGFTFEAEPERRKYKVKVKEFPVGCVGAVVGMQTGPMMTVDAAAIGFRADLGTGTVAAVGMPAMSMGVNGDGSVAAVGFSAHGGPNSAIVGVQADSMSIGMTPAAVGFQADPMTGTVAAVGMPSVSMGVSSVGYSASSHGSSSASVGFSSSSSSSMSSYSSSSASVGFSSSSSSSFSTSSSSSAGVGFQASSSSSSSSSTSAGVGFQASSSSTSAGVGFQAPGAIGVEIEPPKPIKRGKSKTFTHRGWDGAKWESKIQKDARFFHVVRSGNKSKGVPELPIIDWNNQMWLVTIWRDVPGGKQKPRFLVSPPPAERVFRPPFSTQKLQYMSHDGTRCELKLVEDIIPPVFKSTDGGRGGDGGPGGVGAPGCDGGNGGHISISAHDPVLLFHVAAQVLPGEGGSAGLHAVGGHGGPGGAKGGKFGGHDGKPGAQGPVVAQAAPHGRSGNLGSLLYVRIGDNGEVLQQSDKLPGLSMTKSSAALLNGSCVFEPCEPFRFMASLTNTGTISIPPGVVVTMLPNETGGPTSQQAGVLTTQDWVHPGTSVDVGFDCVVGNLLGQNLRTSIVGHIDGSSALNGAQTFGPIAWPIELSSVIQVPNASVGEVFELGCMIKNLSGIPTGSAHGRDVTIQLTVEPGLSFLNDETTGVPPSETPTSCTFTIPSMSGDVIPFTKRLRLADGLKNFSTVKWSLSLIYRGNTIASSQHEVKFIPSFNPSTAKDSDCLLMTHSGISSSTYEQICEKAKKLNLHVATWDYSYQADLQLADMFSSKLVICFLSPQDNALGPFKRPEDLLPHFYDLQGKDLDSSLLFVSPSAQTTTQRLRQLLQAPLHTATPDQLTKSYFGTPTAADMKKACDEIIVRHMPQFPDYAMWAVSNFNCTKVDGGLRSKWLLGTADLFRSTVSLFQRLYAIDDRCLQGTAVNDARWQPFDVALRSSLTTAQKLGHIAASDNATFPLETEASLYYDLKAEFFFASRPLLFYQRIVDLMTSSPEIYGKTCVVESIMRLSYRLLKAAYWKSFGTSPLKSRYYTVEKGVSSLKSKLKGTPGLDVKAIETAAKTGAKAKDRLKWRTQVLPLRLRTIDEKRLNRTTE